MNTKVSPKKVGLLVAAATFSIGLIAPSFTGSGHAEAAASFSAPTKAPGQSQAQPQEQGVKRYGTGGKISLPPPGNWDQPTGPVDTRPLLKPFLPFGMPVFGTDVNVGGGNEVTIASNPTNPLNFLAGANNTARFTTMDGGQTWNVGSLPGGGDPAVAFDAAGRAYFAELGNTATCPDAARVWKSTDGGLTFGSYVEAISDPSPSDHFIDKEWLATDKAPGSPHLGRVYITASSFHTPPGCDLNNYIDNREVLAYSDDQGATWSAPITLSDASHNQDQFTKPVVASDGTLYVSYQYQNCTFNCAATIPMVNLTTRSTDGGLTFSPSITVTGQPISPTGAFVSGYQYLYAGSTTAGFRHNDQAVLDVAPGSPNTLYAVWTDGRWDTSFVYQNVTGQHADIAFSRSTDGGATWSAPIRVNDDMQANGKDQFFPWMIVGSDGTIHVSWMDRRDSPTGFQYREYYSQSTDGGLTWATNQAVADVGGTPSSFIGDYSGIAVNADNTLVIPIWTDTRSGTRAYTDRGVLPPPSTSTTTPTASATSTNTTTPTASATRTSTATIAASTSTASATATGIASATSTPPVATGTMQPSATSTSGLATSTTVPPTACPIQFQDVAADNTFYPYVRCLACRGILGGYPCGGTGEPCGTTNNPYFRPGVQISRGQIAKIVSQSAGFNEAPGNQIYEDVPTASPFYDYINRLSNRGYIGGYPCGQLPSETCITPTNRPYFRPSSNATRGQISKIVATAAMITDPVSGQIYTDVGTDSPFYKWIQQLSARNVMSGYPCGGAGELCDSQNRPYFRPNAEVTRGQASKIVANTFFPNCNTPAHK